MSGNSEWDAYLDGYSYGIAGVIPYQTAVTWPVEVRQAGVAGWSDGNHDRKQADR